ncbi:MAG: NUDIX hydrolase [Ruminococcaceae bacterium]|nr:NUDIX hydrolase [Oscillospiraceae bacterium]
MNLKETQISSQYKYKGKIINMRLDEALLPDGNKALREVVEHPGGVCVVPIDDDLNVTLVRQFRYPYFEEILEIPAGKRDKKDEDPLECGKRELKEEVGATAQNYTFLGKLYPTPGYCGEIIWMYAATGLSYGEQCLDEDEFLYTQRLPLERAVEMVLSGEITDAKTQAALLKVKILIEQGKL